MADDPYESLLSELDAELAREIRGMVEFAGEFGFDRETLREYGAAPIVGEFLRHAPKGVAISATEVAKNSAQVAILRSHASQDFPDGALLPLSGCLFTNHEHHRHDEALPKRLANAAYCRGIVEGMVIGRNDPKARKHLARMFARVGAAAKLARDPKQAAKAKARELWNERRAGMHPKLRTNEQFAVECMRRWPVLASAKVILGWCSKWNREASRKPQSAS